MIRSFLQTICFSFIDVFLHYLAGSSLKLHWSWIQFYHFEAGYKNVHQIPINIQKITSSLLPENVKFGSSNISKRIGSFSFGIARCSNYSRENIYWVLLRELWPLVTFIEANYTITFWFCWVNTAYLRWSPGYAADDHEIVAINSIRLLQFTVRHLHRQTNLCENTSLTTVKCYMFARGIF